MKINKSNLQKALEIVKPGLASKELIEQATSFAFINGCVITYNDEISISHPVDGLELEGAIQAEKLYSILTKLKTDEIEVTINDKEIILQSGKSKIGLTLQSEIKLPLDEDVSEVGKFKKLPANFLKYLKFAVGGSSKEQSQPILTCVNVTQEGEIISSDGFRVTICSLDSEMPVQSFLLPVRSVIDVIKLQPTRIAEGTGWIHFKTDEGTVISCRIFEDEYPDVSTHVQCKGSKLTFPSVVSEMIDRASVFAKRDFTIDELISVSIADKKLKISSDADCGWFEEETNIKYSDTPISFQIMPYLLKGILSEQSECTISSNKMKFEGEGWIYVTALSETKPAKTKKATSNKKSKFEVEENDDLPF